MIKAIQKSQEDTDTKTKAMTKTTTKTNTQIKCLKNPTYAIAYIFEILMTYLFQI